MLVPLVRSDEEDGDRDDEHESYAERRDRRRREGLKDARVVRDRVQRLQKLRETDDAPRDLKPYDVEIVFVLSGLQLADRGEVRLALPECDIPVGQLAWAVFLPADVRVLLAEGNLKEVGSFSLPFRHFADAEYARRAEAVALAKAAEQLAELARAQDAAKQALAEPAKAQGPLPVRVELPIAGQISRYEKLLVVDEAPALTLTYRRKTD